MQLKSFHFLFSMYLVISCTDEPSINSYSVSLKNNTSSVLEIRCFSEQKLQIQKILNQGESSEICNYSAESFYGLSGCDKDSLVIDFGNSKGYIDIRLGNNQNTYRFGNEKSIFIQGMGFQNNGNDYEFVITQIDYNSAHVLPE